MVTLKCKMCGGELQITEDTSVCECEYCGSKQTIPTVDDEKLMKLYDRANRLRMSNEFDKAAGVYESIIEESDTEAEAYWGLLLCKYGIEYVDDPASGDKVPTCHRSSFDSILEDPDFEMVMENSDALARSVYRESAKQIEEIRKGIIEVSGKEEPYDIFICYKETAEDGDRTVDSVMAQDVYDALTGKGYRVFFSRISLEDKLGTEYEPYIFAALNSAKIMLAFGTSYDYYNAVWVKNEWSRYLKLMAKDKEKHLIPCYKDIDAYDMPKEFKHLQAQDMGKVGAVQDLLRGIDKILRPESLKQTISVVQNVSGNTETLLQRGRIALEDSEWNQADKFYEEALNHDAECAEAYLGKLMAQKKVATCEDLGNTYTIQPSEKGQIKEACPEAVDIIDDIVKKYSIPVFLSEESIRQMYVFNRKYEDFTDIREQEKQKVIEKFEDERLLARARQYAQGELHEDIEKMVSSVISEIDTELQKVKKDAEEKIQNITVEYDAFLKETTEKVEALYEKAQQERETAYQLRLKMKDAAKSIKDFEQAEKALEALGDYKDAGEKALQCYTELKRLRGEEKERKQTEEREQARIRAEETAKNKKKKKLIISVVTVTVVILFVLIRHLSNVQNYASAENYNKEENYEEAIQMMEGPAKRGYKDAVEKLAEYNYKYGLQLIQSGKYDEAKDAFLYSDTNGYPDAARCYKYCTYIAKMKNASDDTLSYMDFSLDDVDDLIELDEEHNEFIRDLRTMQGTWKNEYIKLTIKNDVVTIDNGYLAMDHHLYYIPGSSYYSWELEEADISAFGNELYYEGETYTKQ